MKDVASRNEHLDVSTGSSRASSLRDEVRRLAHDWSVELTPRETDKFGAAVREHVPAGKCVYITWLAGSEFGPSVIAATKLRAAGLEPVPHLAARAIRDASTLDGMLRRLRGEADVRRVLVIGGALPRPAGAYSASIDVLKSGLLERHGIRRVGVAGHPEGSPDIGADDLEQALTMKNSYAMGTDAVVELTTQFCFDAAPIALWERRIRASGNRLRVAVGVAGLAGIATLIKHARNCGVGNSINVLLKQGTRILRLAASDPSLLLLGLARARLADSECALARLHFFPFGAFEQTTRFARALEEGRFEIVDCERRISIDH